MHCLKLFINPAQQVMLSTGGIITNPIFYKDRQTVAPVEEPSVLKKLSHYQLF